MLTRSPRAVARVCSGLLVALFTVQGAALTSWSAGASVSTVVAPPATELIAGLQEALAPTASPASGAQVQSQSQATTTTTTTATTSTTAPGGPPPPPPPPPPSGTLTDTGLTRVRFTIDSSAAWMGLDLAGMEILASRVESTTGNARVTSLGGQQIAVNGDGRAVIVAVLSSPPGSATGMAMCKNYLGPATVALDRITNGTARVATFTNTGTSPATPNGCENPASISVDRAALIGPARWPARVDPRPLVMASYYPWYDDAALDHDFGDQPAGPANTFDPAQVAQAVGLAATHGIDAFIIEYDSMPEHRPGIDAVYQSAAASNPPFFAGLMLDFDMLTYKNGGSLTTAVLDAALAAVADYAGSPAQLELGGQPVVFLYGSGRVDPSWWAGALDRLRASTGIVPFVIDQDGRLSAQGRYNYSTNTVPDEAGLNQWAEGSLLEQRVLPGLDGRNGPVWVAPVSPGYDDRRLGRSHPVVVDRAGGQRYVQTWTAALSTLPDWVWITSWNEYYEQTHIAPGTTTGMTALDTTAAYASRFSAEG